MTLFIQAQSQREIPGKILLEEKQSQSPDDIHQLIRQAVSNLPAMQNKVISLIDIFGLSYDECCKAMNINESQLQEHLKKARQSLLKQIRQTC